ncbi:MAG: transporter, family, glucarate transporter [Acidobacteriota bacterium]|jgi:sugar phosphate permease|nr:transporter, family, glucarate transporter [Acidobacteriota bacterium]
MPQHWRVILLLSLVTGVAYLVRADVAVAQERMVPAVGLTMIGMGAITAWGFQLSYALFQVPAGMFGERFGARTALALALFGCSVASFLTSAVPSEGAVPVLVSTRVLLGIAQAAVFPVAAMAVMIYVPVMERVRATAIYIATASLGAAAAPLLMAPVMEQLGWRAVFVLSGVIASVTALIWMKLMPRRPPQPEQHAVRARRGALSELRGLVRNVPLLRLSTAYFLHSAVWFVFVFWFFRYLTEGRGFTILASGRWGGLPSIAAFVLAPLIGMATDRLGRRIGAAQARRRVAMACLFSAAGFVTLGAVLPSAIFAILALSLSSGCVNGAEAPFFTTATAIGAENSGAAAGMLNLMGNLGGVLSIWLVPRMSDAWGWNGTLVFWSGVCVVAAFLWLTVDLDTHAGNENDRLKMTSSATD